MTLNRLVMVEECPWLERDRAPGEVVYRYDGPTYGCISWDGLACTDEPGQTPFFELPAHALYPTPTTDREG